MTFEPREEALGAWQEVKGEAPVNEALYGGARGACTAGRKLTMV